MAYRSTVHNAEMAALRARMQERRWLIGATLVIGLGLALTFRAKTGSFDTVRELLARKEVVNLNALEGSRALPPVLSTLYDDPVDQQLVAEHIYAHVLRQKSRMHLGAAIPNIGYLNTDALAMPARKAETGGAGLRARLIASRARLGMNPDGSVMRDTLGTARLVSQAPYRLEGQVLGPDGRPMEGVTVTLRGDRRAETRADAQGMFRLEGLAEGDVVTVRPVQRYSAFTPQTLRVGGNEQLDFQGQEHRLTLVDGASELQQIKDRLVVRSPEQYTWGFIGLSLFYGAIFIGLHLFWFRRRFVSDAVLLPVVQLLTGLGLLLMFSLQDPLRDLFRAQGYVVGLAAAGVCMAVVSLIDFQHRFWRKQTFAWLGAGVVMAAVLFFFGTGPTGSDAKVNLLLPGIGLVQPVELIKLFLVLFLAGYFARNWLFLRELQQRKGLPRFIQRLDLPRYRDLVPVTLGVLVALLTFFTLRDMGPALVVACTFLVLYGIVRNRWPAVGIGLTALVGVFWYAYRSGAVPMVADRIQMMLSPWENFVYGGEHLAHAYWAMATGGATGQGVGLGHPSYIPAAHTDMVLPALGEEVGLVGLVVVFLLYALLIYRMLRIALRAGGVFSLFLGLSIALIILFQVLLISGGAFGLIPLSGVVTPFISYGKSSMVAHGVMLGMLMSISAREGSELQSEVQRHHFRRPVRYLAIAGLSLLALVVVRAGYIQTLQADDWSIKPALVVRGSGDRAYIYNPRILDARHELTRGTIYDRNGVPLATSRWAELDAQRQEFLDLGVDVDTLDRTTERFYPFHPLTFYLLGDVQSRVKWGADNSLYAEHAYLSHLRGYDNYPQPVEKRRTPEGDSEPIVRYDYTDLVSLVRYGKASPDARALIHRDRDLHLTVDIGLQRRVAEIMEARVLEGKIASAVVLDVATGDVLASVTYPLPDLTRPSEAHADPDVFDRGFGRGAKPPGSTFKLVTAMAAMHQDPGAAAWTHTVHANDRYARRNEPTGRVDMKRGIVASSNVYFAALAHEVVGADSLLKELDYFGFNVGNPGLTSFQKVRLLEEPDNLRQAGFGQGPITGSPLQVALVSAAIANQGVLPEIRWVREAAERRQPVRYVMMPHQAQVLAGFMRGVVTEPGGTGAALREAGVPMAGKTGTAEEKMTKLRDGKPVRVTLNHAWFTGFAPYYEPGREHGPQIAIAVLVEEGGSGGRAAAPIAGDIAEAAADLGLIKNPGVLNHTGLEER